jgi:hypothetical protein
MEYISSSSQKHHQMISNISSTDINSLNCTIYWESFKDWRNMTYSITTVQYHTWCATLCV